MTTRVETEIFEQIQRKIPFLGPKYSSITEELIFSDRTLTISLNGGHPDFDVTLTDSSDGLSVDSGSQVTLNRGNWTVRGKAQPYSGGPYATLKATWLEPQPEHVAPPEKNSEKPLPVIELDLSDFDGPDQEIAQTILHQWKNAHGFLPAGIIDMPSRWNLLRQDVSNRIRSLTKSKKPTTTREIIQPGSIDQQRKVLDALLSRLSPDQAAQLLPVYADAIARAKESKENARIGNSESEILYSGIGRDLELLSLRLSQIALSEYTS